MVLKTLCNFATKRIPLIKFRKGGNVAGSGPHSSATPSVGGVSKSPKVSSSPAIEDWELPARYRRKLLDPVEIDYINRGGPP